ncbi:MAG: hypothetical protein M3065_02680, partial [Actinomycetota bacterium]|nr:hypothetical protein [Actinomycetota bacterium]
DVIVASASGLSVIAVATLIAGLAALLGISRSLLAVYAKTAGRRRDRRARLARLGTGAHLSFFEAILGEPPAMRRSLTSGHTECIFVDREYYVQTISDGDGTVLAFSVTTRNRRFRPTYEVPFRPGYVERRRLKRRFNYTYVPSVSVALGRSTFASLDPTDPDRFAGPHYKVSVGAHNWTYSEFHPLGNPGYYQTVVLTASDVAAQAPYGNAWNVQEELGGSEWPDPTRSEDQPRWGDLSAAHQFRQETVITTYTVVRDLSLEDYPASFGPQLHIVRTLP